MEQDVTMYQGFADTYDRLMENEIPYDGVACLYFGTAFGKIR